MPSGFYQFAERRCSYCAHLSLFSDVHFQLLTEHQGIRGFALLIDCSDVLLILGERANLISEVFALATFLEDFVDLQVRWFFDDLFLLSWLLFLEGLLKMLGRIGKLCFDFGCEQFSSFLRGDGMRIELCFKYISGEANILGDDSFLCLHPSYKCQYYRTNNEKNIFRLATVNNLFK